MMLDTLCVQKNNKTQNPLTHAHEQTHTHTSISALTEDLEAAINKPKGTFEFQKF